MKTIRRFPVFLTWALRCIFNFPLCEKDFVHSVHYDTQSIMIRTMIAARFSWPGHSCLPTSVEETTPLLSSFHKIVYLRTLSLLMNIKVYKIKTLTCRQVSIIRPFFYPYLNRLAYLVKTSRNWGWRKKEKWTVELKIQFWQRKQLQLRWS